MTRRPLILVAAALAAPAALAQQPAPSGTAPPVIPPGSTVLILPPGAAPPTGAAPAATAAPTPRRASATIAGAFNQGTTQVTAEVLSLRRESGTLMLRVLMINEGGVNANSVPMHLALAEAYIVDPANQRRAGVMRGGGDTLSTDMGSSGVPAGGRREMFAQFPEPPPNVSSVNLYLRGFPPIMGVPIQ